MRRIAEWIFNLDIKASDRLVLFALCRSIGCGDSEVEASLSDIRSSTSLATNTIRKSIHRLLALGLIERSRGGRGGRKPRYTIKMTTTKIGTPTKIGTTKIGMVQSGSETSDRIIIESKSHIPIPDIKESIESIESIETEHPFSPTISILRGIEGYNLTFEKEQGLLAWLDSKNCSIEIAEGSANAMYMNLSLHHAKDGSTSWTYRKSDGGKKSGYYKTLDGVFRAWVGTRMRDAPKYQKQTKDPSEVFRLIRESRR